jgi:putative phosphonate metabolism protein
MTAFPRYAIYYAPAPETALHAFGSRVLGYDAFTRETATFPDNIISQVSDWKVLTEAPRKYGFHATLKAPFVLAPGFREEQLCLACDSFAETLRIPTISPVVRAIGGFVAIVPDQKSAALNLLAQECVTRFDSFRAPMTTDDRARRMETKLTERQRLHLDRWGYPYVMEDFRFHMTLTGDIEPARLDSLVSLLGKCFDDLKLGSLSIDRIAVFRQETPASRFEVIHSPALKSAKCSGVS